MKVFITGMGRSGTSMVTDLLQMCNLYLGNNLLQPRKDNPKGFFEDLEFLAINKEIFRLNSNGGGGGHKPPKEIKVLPDKLITKMKQFIDKWPKDKIVGWKDPRTCITFPIWEKLIQPEKIRVVIVSRPFDEIAQSLKKRHGIKIIDGMNLCSFYMKSIYENLGKTKWMQTFFHNYFSPDWINELKGLTEFLGLNLPDNLNLLKDSIDINLWHHGRNKG